MIGIFDSGIGGMTVAKAIETALNGFPLIYFGDLARTPYGSKSNETIAGYALQDTQFLISKGASAIIIACNSAASAASDLIRDKFDLPIFEVITPAIEKAVAATTNGRIGIIGTRATITSNIYERKITALDKSIKVFSQACPLLVPLVEEGWLNKRETKMIVKRYLHSLKHKNIDTLVLGCTHYPLLKHLIQPRIGKQVKIIDSSEAIAASVQRHFSSAATADHVSAGTEHQYFVSDITNTAAYISNKIFGRPITLQKADVF